MTTLYLLRHGIAFDADARRHESDSDRRLTPEGEKKIRRIAGNLRTLGVELDLVLTSPFARAHRTAEIVVEVFKIRKKFAVSDDLAVGGSPEALLRHLNEHHTSARSVMLVGHEPYLSELISILLVGDTGLALDLKKGGLCKLAMTRPNFGRCATLEWLLPPRAMIQ